MSNEAFAAAARTVVRDMSQFMHLHHVQVLCPSGAEATARAFYHGILGLREIPKPSTLPATGVWYELDDARQLHIGTLREGDTPAASRAHFALRTEAIEPLMARLNAEHIPYVERDDISGWRRIQFRDPFRNAIEVVEITA